MTRGVLHEEWQTTPEQKQTSEIATSVDGQFVSGELPCSDSVATLGGQLLPIEMATRSYDGLHWLRFRQAGLSALGTYKLIQRRPPQLVAECLKFH